MVSSEARTTPSLVCLSVRSLLVAAGTEGLVLNFSQSDLATPEGSGSAHPSWGSEHHAGRTTPVRAKRNTADMCRSFCSVSVVSATEGSF